MQVLRISPERTTSVGGEAKGSSATIFITRRPSLPSPLTWQRKGRAIR